MDSHDSAEGKFLNFGFTILNLANSKINVAEKIKIMDQNCNWTLFVNFLLQLSFITTYAICKYVCTSYVMTIIHLQCM